MVFSSVTFLFYFLPILLLIYFIVGRKWQNIILLIASLVFYAWGESLYALIMLFSITGNYFFGLVIDKHRNKTSFKKIFIWSLVFNIGMLGFFKYTNFLCDNLNILLGFLSLPLIHIKNIHLPIGISFFTFQAMSYVIDVYRGRVDVNKSWKDFGLYISMFPQLIAGPIVRYCTISKQLKERVVNIDGFAYGLKRFVIGLAKKVLIANNVGYFADKVFVIPVSELYFSISALGILCYTLQIFFDFSGYSDMAIGLGKMFGFDFPENFRFPYIAKSVKEFWRRWHITLSTWFKDYVYIPLGGNRIGVARTYLNLVLVFFLTGVWHGAAWNFIVWGLYHGLFLALERGSFGTFLKKTPNFIQHVYLLVVVMVGWVFFRAEDLGYAFGYLKSLIGLNLGNELIYPIKLYLDNEVIVAIIVGIIISTPIFKLMRRQFIKLRSSKIPSVIFNPTYATLSVLGFVSILFLSMLSIASNTYNPFIYFRF